MQRSTLLVLCLLGLTFSEASAQRYTLRAPPKVLDEVSIGSTIVSSCHVSLLSLGNIYGVYNRVGQYNDGSVDEDDTADTKYADGKTYNFSYISLLQLTDASGNPNYMGYYLKLSALKAEAVDGTFDWKQDSGVMEGLDIDYAHYFDVRHHFGVTVGMNTGGFSIEKSADWEVVVTSRSDLYKAEGLDGLSYFTGFEDRPRVFSTTTPEAYIYYENPISLGESVLGETGASGSWDVTGAIVNFKLGGVYNFNVTRRFIMRLSGGLLIQSVSSRFRWDEAYVASMSGVTGTIEVSGTCYKHKFQFGEWGDLSAHYRVNRKMTVFGGLQYLNAGTMEQISPQGHHIEIDCSNMYAMRSGFTWAF